MVAEYVTGLKAAWDVAKALKVATDSIGDAQLKLRMAELISALADAKIEAAENAEKIAELQRTLHSKSQLRFVEGKYFKDLEEGTEVGPFCATCFDSTSKEIRLQHLPGATFGDWHCRVCDGCFR